MTKEEILEMKPGKELDVLVAHEIFDIDVEWDYPSFDIDKQLPKLPFRKGEPRIDLNSTGHSIENVIYEYSTDITAAWQVVEKMQEYGLAKDFTLYWGNGWWCFFIYGQNSAEAKSAPEAICKAALIAKIPHQESEVKNGNR